MLTVLSPMVPDCERPLIPVLLTAPEQKGFPAALTGASGSAGDVETGCVSNCSVALGL